MPIVTRTRTSATSLSGQSGGDDGKVLRLIGPSQWQNADITDGIDELFALAFKASGKYFTSGAVVPVAGVIPGTVYYLSAAGAIADVPPPLIPNMRRVAVGKAIAPDQLLFCPSIVVSG
jgi:hypothetical protein